MRLYLFRLREEVPMETMNFLAEKTTEILEVDPVVFEQPLNKGVGETDIAGLLKISDSFLERGEPVVAVVFTSENLLDEEVLGEGSGRNRGVWVKSTGDLNKTLLTYIHELCHVFEAEHCTRRDCLMYPYYTHRDIGKISLETLLCNQCLRYVRESWVYSRLISSAKARKGEKKLHPEIISIASRKENVKARDGTIPKKAQLPVSSRLSFPEWSLPKEEFIRKAKEFFEYED